MKKLHEELKSKRGNKAMHTDARPREKMAANGGSGMEDFELLEILVGSGSPNESLELAGRLMDVVGGSLTVLAEVSLADLCRFSGMGLAKSSKIMAAMELALRLSVALSVR